MGSTSVNDLLRIVGRDGAINVAIDADPSPAGVLTVTPGVPLTYVGDAGVPAGPATARPVISGSAFTNNVGTATATTFYGIDASRPALVRQSVAGGVPGGLDSGQLTTIGTLGGYQGVTLDQRLGFDIGPDGTAYVALNQSGLTTRLRTIDLATGTTDPSGSGSIAGTATDKVVDIAVAPVGVLGFGTDATTPENSTALVPITVTRSSGSFGTVEVDVVVSGGSAAEGLDYTVSPSTLLFGPGETTKTVGVQVLDDHIVEGSETIGLRLSSPRGGAGLGDTDLTLTITDGSPGTIKFGLATQTVNEGTAPAVSVVRTGGQEGEVSAKVTALSASPPATPGADYAFTTTRITFAPGDTTAKNVPVQILDDAEAERNEKFELHLSDEKLNGSVPGVAILGTPNPTTITIQDVNPGAFRLDAASYAVTEGGSVTITVIRAGGAGGSAQVGYATSEGTARSSGTSTEKDYTATSGTLAFGQGVVSQSFTIVTQNNTPVEPTETVDIRLTSVNGSTLASPSAAVLQILDNDANTTSGEIHFGQGTLSVDEDAGTLTVPVLRLGGTQGAHFGEGHGAQRVAAAGERPGLPVRRRQRELRLR